MEGRKRGGEEREGGGAGSNHFHHFQATEHV